MENSQKKFEDFKDFLIKIESYEDFILEVQKTILVKEDKYINEVGILDLVKESIKKGKRRLLLKEDFLITTSLSKIPLSWSMINKQWEDFLDEEERLLPFGGKVLKLLSSLPDMEQDDEKMKLVTMCNSDVLCIKSNITTNFMTLTPLARKALAQEIGKEKADFLEWQNCYTWY